MTMTTRTTTRLITLPLAHARRVITDNQLIQKSMRAIMPNLKACQFTNYQGFIQGQNWSGGEESVTSKSGHCFITTKYVPCERLYGMIFFWK